MLKIEEVTTEDTYELRVIDARGEETVSYIGTEETICGLCLQDFVKVSDTVLIIDNQTGEILQEVKVENQAGLDELIIESDEEDYEPDDSMLECGYDPYMGCYSDDC